MERQRKTTLSSFEILLNILKLHNVTHVNQVEHVQYEKHATMYGEQVLGFLHIRYKDEIINMQNIKKHVLSRPSAVCQENW